VDNRFYSKRVLIWLVGWLDVGQRVFFTEGFNENPVTTSTVKKYNQTCLGGEIWCPGPYIDLPDNTDIGAVNAMICIDGY
jgi:hypothetical protein